MDELCRQEFDKLYEQLVANRVPIDDDIDSFASKNELSQLSTTESLAESEANYSNNITVDISSRDSSSKVDEGIISISPNEEENQVNNRTIQTVQQSIPLPRAYDIVKNYISKKKKLEQVIQARNSQILLQLSIPALRRNLYNGGVDVDASRRKYRSLLISYNRMRKTSRFYENSAAIARKLIPKRQGLKVSLRHCFTTVFIERHNSITTKKKRRKRTLSCLSASLVKPEVDTIKNRETDKEEIKELNRALGERVNDFDDKNSVIVTTDEIIKKQISDNIISIQEEKKILNKSTISIPLRLDLLDEEQISREWAEEESLAEVQSHPRKIRIKPHRWLANKKPQSYQKIGNPLQQCRQACKVLKEDLYPYHFNDLLNKKSSSTSLAFVQNITSMKYGENKVVPNPPLIASLTKRTLM